MSEKCSICDRDFEQRRGCTSQCSPECKKEARRRYMREYHLTHPQDPDKKRQAYHKWYQNKGVEYHKQWRDSHPENMAIRNKKTNEKKKVTGRKKVYDAAFYQKNRARLIAANTERGRVNADKYRPFRQAALIRYRARKRNAIGDFTAKEFSELCEACDNFCAYCYKKFDRLTADHILPLTRSGSNGIENIIPACMSCNASKQDRTPLEYVCQFRTVKRA